MTDIRVARINTMAQIWKRMTEEYLKFHCTALKGEK